MNTVASKYFKLDDEHGEKDLVTTSEQAKKDKGEWSLREEIKKRVKDSIAETRYESEYEKVLMRHGINAEKRNTKGHGEHYIYELVDGIPKGEKVRNNKLRSYRLGTDYGVEALHESIAHRSLGGVRLSGVSAPAAQAVTKYTEGKPLESKPVMPRIAREVSIEPKIAKPVEEPAKPKGVMIGSRMVFPVESQIAKPVQEERLRSEELKGIESVIAKPVSEDITPKYRSVRQEIQDQVVHAIKQEIQQQREPEIDYAAIARRAIEEEEEDDEKIKVPGKKQSHYGKVENHPSHVNPAAALNERNQQHRRSLRRISVLYDLPAHLREVVELDEKDGLEEYDEFGG